MITRFLLVFVVAYLLGSVSFAIVVSKTLFKKDIRSFGSGNAGMTNVLRTFGKKAAALTIVGDILKGVVSVMFARLVFGGGYIQPQATNMLLVFGKSFEITGGQMLEIGMYLAVLGSFLGHLYPIFFKFKGGKGVSVIAGSMIATTPITLSIALGLFLILVFTTKIVSLSSIVATVSYLFITLIYFKVTGTFSLLNLLAAIIFPSFIVYSHRTNIKRLLNGTEYKFGKKKE
ncbi:MAG: glycerol-3-phosphate 1-O-acyltransferase PlsY [Oscillospiraceae bacterium]